MSAVAGLPLAVVFGNQSRAKCPRCRCFMKQTDSEAECGRCGDSYTRLPDGTYSKAVPA